MSSFRRTCVVGLVLCTALQFATLVLLGNRAAAEQSGPVAIKTVEATWVRYHPRAHVSGSFKIQGSEIMYPLLTRLSTEFQRRQPKVIIDVRGGGSTKAIEELLQPPLSKVGKVMWPEDRAISFKMTASSRELSGSEIKEFVIQHGYEPMVVPVAVDAVALYIHKDNPLPGLTLDQVGAIFSATHNHGDATAIVQWGQLGLADEWKTTPIHLYGRDHKSGTRAFFKEHVLAGGDFRPGLRETPGPASVILSVSRDSLGIGYSGLGLQASTVRVVPLAQTLGEPFVMPSSTSVADQTYPLQRVLYLYIDTSPQSPMPAAAQEFLTFLRSFEGQEAVMSAGFFPLPPQEKKSAVALEFAPVATPIR